MTREELEEMLRLSLIAKLDEGKMSENDRVSGIIDAMVTAYNRAIEDAKSQLMSSDFEGAAQELYSLKIQ